MDINYYTQFIYAYSTTAQIMFPILVFILILFIIDINKSSKISAKIQKRLKDLVEIIEDTGFKKKHDENYFQYIERYLSSKITKD